MDKHTREESKKQFTITTFVSILAIVFAIVAAGIGAYLGDYFQNKTIEQTTAKQIYDDIDRLGWTLNDLNQKNIDNPRAVPIIFTSIFQDTDTYFSSRSNIALLDESVARSISIFYSNLQYAEKYRQAIYNLCNSNRTRCISPNIDNFDESIIEISMGQYKNAISDACKLRPQILRALEKKYGIEKNPPNRFNIYSENDLC